jgi:hypothetical protein
MSKKLNVESISQELAGSAFFPPRKTPADPEVTEEQTAPERQTVDNKMDDQGVPPHVPPKVPQGVPPTLPLIPKVKRPIRQRQPFDIYEDQYQKLKAIADTEKGFVNGRGMSQMVREAIDNYLRDHNSSKK